jgi:signal transduction histidine kinase
MPSKIKFPRPQLGLKVALWYSLLFVLSTGLVFLLVYKIFEKSLENSDHEIIETKLKQYQTLFEKDGINGLKNISSDPSLGAESFEFLIRLANTAGETVLVHVPPVPHFDIVAVETEISKRTKPARWTTIETKEDEDVFEILTAPLGNGLILQVGRSSGERQDLLDKIQCIFGAGLLIAIVIGFTTGLWFALRLLTPVRRLIRTMKTIESGDLKARVASNNTGDELQKLTTLFNSMLDRIQLLISAQRELTDNVAHDLKTPVTRMRAAAENVLQKSSSVEELREALADCIENSEEILMMVNTVMDIVDADSGVMNLKSERIDIRKLIDEVADLYEFSIEDKSLKLTVDVPHEIFYFGDPIRLKQVISNLVDNAVKYTSPSGLLSIHATLNDKVLVIKVEDTGMGIEPHDLPRIWERLYRADKSRSQQGLVLGLSLVRSIVEAQGGAVSVTSIVGKGSCFQVNLPAVTG